MRIPAQLVPVGHAILCLATFFSLSLTRSSAADELLGADAVLQQLAGVAASPEAKQTNALPRSLLRTDIAAFVTNSIAMPSADAVNGWLVLADRIFEFDAKSDPSMMGGRGDPLSFQLLEALPGPTTWSALQKAVEARPQGSGARGAFELGLRLLVHTLENDTAARNTDLSALEELSRKSPKEASWTFRNAFEQLNKALLETSDDPELVLKTLEREFVTNEEEQWRNSIEVPNLVTLVGDTKTESFLRKALVHPKFKLQISAGTATHKLAQKLALELADQLKVPQWGLVNSLGATALYEALEKHFPAKTNSADIKLDVPTLDLPDQQEKDHELQNARLYYLLGLISEGRAKDAVAVAQKFAGENDVYLPPDGLKALEQAGYTAALDNFLHELLSQNPEVPFWNYYANLSAKAGKTERMLELARSTLLRKDLGGSSKAALQQNLYAALLAADKVEEGVVELRKQISQPPVRRNMRNRYSSMDSRLNPALTLARLGQLESRKDWLEEGISTAKNALADSKEKSPVQWNDSSTAKELAGILVGLGRHAEAEAALVTELKESVRQASNQRNARNNHYGMPNQDVAQHLGALALLYHDIGRPADVVALLDRSPDWGVDDLARLNRYDLQNVQLDVAVSHLRQHGLPLQFIAASALNKSGRKAEAKKILASVLNDNPGLDAAYELLLEISGNDAPAQLDTLLARDRFEERPLIWKAEWLRRKGDFEAAETACRQAISIDPSDGEQGPGNRMRAYAVLAAIREARGDAKEAEFFRGAVSAIRLSERADRFAQAGLIKRAVQMYKDSLTKFADAYCIQSRLAVQLAELGLHEEAEAHYRRAYELMPESFGRVESHCFGCERAFEGQKAQSLAEKIFSELAVKTPNKPQVHYLLGYLREEQERYQEAVVHYQKAVALDPDHLNAWIKIQQLGSHVRLPATQRDDVGLNIFRLDPLSRHSHVSLETVSDLRRVWRVVAEGQQFHPTQPKALFPLTASQSELEKKSSRSQNIVSPDEDDEPFGGYGSYPWRTNAKMTPALVLRQNTFVQTAGRLMSAEFTSALSTD